MLLLFNYWKKEMDFLDITVCPNSQINISVNSTEAISNIFFWADF